MAEIEFPALVDYFQFASTDFNLNCDGSSPGGLV